MRILQEGRFYHVESYIELRLGLTLSEADNIKSRIRHQLLAYEDVTDVTLGIIEDTGVKDWPTTEQSPPKNSERNNFIIVPFTVTLFFSPRRRKPICFIEYTQEINYRIFVYIAIF